MKTFSIKCTAWQIPFKLMEVQGLINKVQPMEVPMPDQLKTPDWVSKDGIMDMLSGESLNDWALRKRKESSFGGGTIARQEEFDLIDERTANDINL